MTTTEPERAASQRELDILRERVDQMDMHGTRGTMAAVSVLQTQVTEMVKDLTALAAVSQGWQATHEEHHKQDKEDRVNGRRWLIGTGIAGIAAMVTVIGLLLDIASHIH